MADEQQAKGPTVKYASVQDAVRAGDRSAIRAMMMERDASAAQPPHTEPAAVEDVEPSGGGSSSQPMGSSKDAGSAAGSKDAESAAGSKDVESAAGSKDAGSRESQLVSGGSFGNSTIDLDEVKNSIGSAQRALEVLAGLRNSTVNEFEYIGGQRTRNYHMQRLPTNDGGLSHEFVADMAQPMVREHADSVFLKMEEEHKVLTGYRADLAHSGNMHGQYDQQGYILHAHTHASTHLCIHVHSSYTHVYTHACMHAHTHAGISRRTLMYTSCRVLRMCCQRYTD